MMTTLTPKATRPFGRVLAGITLLAALLAGSGCSMLDSFRAQPVEALDTYPYPLHEALENRVGDALRIAQVRIEQLNLSGGGDCIPGRIYRLQQLAYRAHREHLSGLHQDALHNLRVLDQQINDTEMGLRYLQTRTTCLENKPDRTLLAMRPLLNELSAFSFDFDLARLPQGMNDPLDALVRWLKEHPVYRVRLTGHTDAIGKEAYNAKLALNRAETIARYLHNAGIPPYQVISDGLGEHEPVSSNALAVDREKNRRVDFRLELLLERSQRQQQVKNWPAVTDLWGGY